VKGCNAEVILIKDQRALISTDLPTRTELSFLITPNVLYVAIWMLIGPIPLKYRKLSRKRLFRVK